MSFIRHLPGWPPYKRGAGALPGPALQDLAETVQAQGHREPEPECVYLRARDLPMPRHPDPVVFGPPP